MGRIYVFEISLCVESQVVGYAEPEGGKREMKKERGGGDKVSAVHHFSLCHNQFLIFVSKTYPSEESKKQPFHDHREGSANGNGEYNFHCFVESTFLILSSFSYQSLLIYFSIWITFSSYLHFNYLPFREQTFAIKAVAV